MYQCTMHKTTDYGHTKATSLILIVRPKIPQMPKNLSAQFVCPSPKVWHFIEKKIYWVSVVHGQNSADKSGIPFEKQMNSVIRKLVTDRTFGLAELFGRTSTVRFGPNDRTFFCRTQNLFFSCKKL